MSIKKRERKLLTKPFRMLLEQAGIRVMPACQSGHAASKLDHEVKTLNITAVLSVYSY